MRQVPLLAIYDSAVSSSLAVRPARVGDVAQMARVNVRCWQETYRGLMSGCSAPWRPRRNPTISAAGTRSLGLTRCRSREILSQTLKGTPLAREQVPVRLVLSGLGTGRGSGTALKTAGKDGPVAGLARSPLRDLPAGSASAE